VFFSAVTASQFWAVLDEESNSRTIVSQGN